MAHNFIIYSNRALTRDYLNALFLEVWTGPPLALTTSRVPPDLADAYDAFGPNDVYLTFRPQGGARLSEGQVAELRDAVVDVKNACGGTAYCPINGGEAGAAGASPSEHKHFFRFWKNKH